MDILSTSRGEEDIVSDTDLYISLSCTNTKNVDHLKAIFCSADEHIMHIHVNGSQVEKGRSKNINV